jgi:tetratricopeptide (TPR) repeat protein
LESMELWRTAEVYWNLGRFEDAIITAGGARRSFESIGNRRMMAKADCVLAASYLQTGALDKASDLYNDAIDIFSEAEDAPMERSILLGLGLVDLAYQSQKPKPDHRKSLQVFMDIEAKYTSIDDPYLTVYKDLACAEALRLTYRAEGALTRFHDVIKISNLYGYQLEKAHALLGIAATKLLGAEADRQSCNQALKLYQKVGSVWGQVQALIIQALIERDTGNSSAHLLQQASILARENSLFAASQLIETLNIQDPIQKDRHVLLFLQAV